MSKFDDGDNKGFKATLPQPHPDLAENIAYFNKQMGRVRWLPNDRECPVRVELHDTYNQQIFNPQTGKNETVLKVKEYMHVLFIFPKGQEMATFNISFHQTCRRSDKFAGFKDELAAALNYFGQHGWLENTVKNNNGTFRDPNKNKTAPGAYDRDDKWNELFGGK